MPMNTPRFATVAGGLDDVLAADGRPLGALGMAAIERQHNYLTSARDPMFSFAWDARPDTDENEGAPKGYAPPFWVPITPPMMFPKKAGARTMVLYMGAQAPGGTVIWFQVATTRKPFNPAALYGDVGVGRFTGAGTTWVDTGVGSTPVDAEAPFETVQVYVMGLPIATLGSTGANGTPNTGTIDLCTTDTNMRDNSAAWNVTGPSGNSWAVGHSVRVNSPATGALIQGHRLITAVTSANDLEVHPPWSVPRTGLAGQEYTIEELPTWRLSYAIAYTEERTS